MSDDRSISERLALEDQQDALNITSAPNVAAIPSAMTDDIPALRRTVQALRQVIELREGRTGSVLDKHLTLRDLMDAGTISLNVGANKYTGNINTALVLPSGFVDRRPELSVPPTLTSLVARAAFKNVILTWEMLAYANHAFVEVWRSTTDALGTAVLNGTTTANIYTDASGVLGTTYYYWARAINQAGALGAFNAVSGVSAALATIAGVDLADLIITADKLSQGTYPGTNLVPNPGAEDGVVAWDSSTAFETNAPSLWTVDTGSGEHTSGSQGFTLAKSSAGQRVGAGCRAFPLIPGETYGYRIKILGSSTTTGVWVRLQQKATKPPSGYIGQVGGANVAEATIDLQTAVTMTGAFVEYKGTFTAGAGMFWATFMVLLNTGGTCLRVWFDDCKVGRHIIAEDIKAGTITAGNMVAGTITAASGIIGDLTADIITAGTLAAARIAAGSLDANKITAGTITADRIGANVITASQISTTALSSDNTLTRSLTVRDASGNIVLQAGSPVLLSTPGVALNSDPNCSYGLDWSHPAAVVTGITGGVTGTTCLRSVDAGTNNHIQGLKSFPLNRTRALRVSCLARKNGTPTGATFYLGLLSRLSTGVEDYGVSPYYSDVSINVANLTTTFARVSRVITVPMLAALSSTVFRMSPHVILGYDGTGSMVGTIDVQDFRVEEVGSGALVLDTAFGGTTATDNSVALSAGTVSNYNTSWKTTNAHVGGAYVEATLGGSSAGLFMLALDAAPALGNAYTTLDYALHTSGGSLYIYESGVSVYGPAGSFAVGDVFAVSYDGFNVRYLQNGVVLRTVAAAASLKLFAAGSLFALGDTLTNMKWQPNGFGVKIDSSNASTYIADAAIGSAHIGSLNADVITSGSVRGISVVSATHATQGSYLTALALLAATTLTLKDTSDFHASGGTCHVMDTTNDRDVFTYTGKTTTTLTGCSGVLAHNSGAFIIPVITNSVHQKIVALDKQTNELRFWGDRGDGTTEELASIGVTGFSSDSVVGQFGSINSGASRIGVVGQSYSAQGGVFSSQTDAGLVGSAGSSGVGFGVFGTTATVGGAGVYGAPGYPYSLVGPPSTVAAYGVRGDATHSAYAGVYGGGTDATGVWGSASAGWGGRFDANATKGSVYMPVRAGRPTDRTVGSVYVGYTTGGSTDARTLTPRLMVADGTNWRQVHDDSVFAG